MSSLRTNSSVKAFTLLELLVGMVVSGIVLGAMFTAYHIITKQAIVYREKAKMNEELSLLHSRLVRDFQEAEIVSQSNEISLTIFCRFPTALEVTKPENPAVTKLDNLEVKNIEYEFHSEFTLRKMNDHADTFLVAVAACKGFLNGEESTDADAVVDEVRLTVKTGELNEEIRLKKMNDAKTRLSEVP